MGQGGGWLLSFNLLLAVVGLRCVGSVGGCTALGRCFVGLTRFGDLNQEELRAACPCPLGSSAAHSWPRVLLRELLGRLRSSPANSRCCCCPHKLRECLPLIIFLRNRLKYALTGDEVKKICMQRFIKIDGKVRTDITYPAGFMDVISIEKTGEHFRLVYDTKGRFAVHRITAEEAKYKLCKVRKIFVGTKGIPHLVTHDARTIRYPDPLIKVNDTVQIDLETGKITDFIKFDTGNLCMVTGGANLGRIGVITNRERHPGSFDVVHVKDANGNSFATRLSNIFVIVGGGCWPWISLPRGKGIRLTIAEERDKRLAAKQSSG
uniref:RNA-binding S4 domain-containing protein n=1 Tax=Bubo bubo TaxID=30461 RepID=A0A8C0EBC2_BUBBB